MRGHFTTLQVLHILLALANGLWGLLASFWLYIFIMAGMNNSRFPGLTPQGYNLYLCWYGAWALFTWLSCLANFMAGLGAGRGRWQGLLLTTALLNLVPGISFLWLCGIPVGLYGLFVSLSQRSRVIFKAVRRGVDFNAAVDDELGDHLARGRSGRRPGRRGRDEDDGDPRDDCRNDPPRESW